MTKMNKSGPKSIKNSTDWIILNFKVKNLFPNNKCLISIFVPSNNKPKLVRNLCTMKLYDSKKSVWYVFNVLLKHCSEYRSPFIFNGLFQVCNGLKQLSTAANASQNSTHTFLMWLRSGDSAGYFKTPILNTSNHYFTCFERCTDELCCIKTKSFRYVL